MTRVRALAAMAGHQSEEKMLMVKPVWGGALRVGAHGHCLVDKVQSLRVRPPAIFATEGGNLGSQVCHRCMYQLLAGVARWVSWVDAV